MTAIIDDAMIKELEASFIARNDQIVRWSDAVSQMQMLPGLRGLWPMSSFGATGQAFDVSGNSRTLTYNGNPTYNYDQYGRVPYIDLDGTGDYLSRADEAGLDITGTESFVAAAIRGLTATCWLWGDSFANSPHFFNKRSATPNFSWQTFIIAGVISFLPSSVADGSTRADVTSSVTIVTEAWNFIAVRFQPNAASVIFVNGTKDTGVNTIASIFSGNAPLEWGDLSAFAGNELDGRLSLCSLCATALPDGIIQSLYNSQKHFFGV